MKETKNLSKNSKPPELYIAPCICIYRFITSDEPRVPSNMCVYYIWLSSSEDLYWNPSSSFRLIAFYEHVSIFLWHFHLTVQIIQKREPYSLTASNHFRYFSTIFFAKIFFFFCIHNYTEIGSWSSSEVIFQRWKKNHL